MNRLQCISINYRVAPVEIREKVIVSLKDLEDLVPRDGELYALVTCNRTEVYWTGAEEEAVLARLAERSGLGGDQLLEACERHQGREAVRHLFRVAAGLDSLVIGEAQILGQVKEAYRDALDAKSTSTFIDKALHRAFRTAKRVRTETDIGKYPVSVASEAVELACRIFGDIAESCVLVIGAGDMAGIAATRLKDRGAGKLVIVNRTHAAACTLADELGGTPRPFESLKEELVRCDIIIASTGSPVPIITKALMDEVMKARRHRPLIIIDIAVPRDVDQAVSKCYNCYLYDIDALKSIVDRHLANREEQAEKACGIVAQEVDLFEKWVHSLNAQATIQDLFSLLDTFVEDEVRGSDLTGEEADRLEESVRISLRRLIHRVVSFLKEHPSLANIEHTRRIFQLDANYQDRHKG
jgi:glutamyl-tRNA reductase